MKITVDLPESTIRDVCRAAGTRKKGPAVRKLVQEAILLRRRAEVAAKFVSGEWGVDLEGWEEAQRADHEDAVRSADRTGA